MWHMSGTPRWTRHWHSGRRPRTSSFNYVPARRPRPESGRLVTVRPALASDTVPLQRLMRELVASEVPFGAVRARAPELSDTYAVEAVVHSPGWTVVAEHDGEVIGWANITPPEQSAWASASVRRGPAAYLGVAVVTAAERSRGIGRALVAALHRHAAEEGVALVLLDASNLNPWSMPFWQRQGYRPLWVTWHRRG